jgi:glycosyltransferase involved in cell wall biosynthesis
VLDAVVTVAWRLLPRQRVEYRYCVPVCKANICQPWGRQYYCPRRELIVKAYQPLLLICTSAGVGGTERVVLALAKGLAGQGLEVETLFPEAQGETGASFLADSMGAVIQTTAGVRNFRLSRRPRHIIALYRLVRAKRARLVNIHFGNNRISIWDVLAIRLAGAQRCFASVHHASPLSSRRARFATRLVSLLCSRVVVTTPVLTEILVGAGVPQRKIIEIPLGLDQPKPARSQREARKVLELPPDALVIGSLGRLVASKGFDDLIAAVALIKRGIRPIHLVIGGEGPLEHRLRDLARSKLGARSQVLGRISDPGLLYAASDLFALASHEEGFGLVFIEAALHGIPSVAADVGGVSFAIAHGQTGTIVAHGDLPALANAMSTLLHDDKERGQMGAAARARAIREFTVDKLVEPYRKLLFETVG